MRNFFFTVNFECEFFWKEILNGAKISVNLQAKVFTLLLRKSKKQHHM